MFTKEEMGMFTRFIEAVETFVEYVTNPPEPTPIELTAQEQEKRDLEIEMESVRIREKLDQKQAIAELEEEFPQMRLARRQILKARLVREVVEQMESGYVDDPEGLLGIVEGRRERNRIRYKKMQKKMRDQLRAAQEAEKRGGT